MRVYAAEPPWSAPAKFSLGWERGAEMWDGTFEWKLVPRWTGSSLGAVSNIIEELLSRSAAEADEREPDPADGDGGDAINFQNIPRHDKVVKRAFVPKRGAFSFFDYSQIEPRLTAYFASKIGYPEFADQIRGGVDSYTAVAKLITGKSEITDEERQKWKVTYLSLLYGGGVKTIQLQFGNSAAEAKSIINTFHKNWPAVRELQQRVQAAHRKRGYILGVDGRHLHMEEFGEHKLLNKLIQGSAAGLIKQAIRNVHRFLRTPAGERVGLTFDDPVEEDPNNGRKYASRMVSVVHDELIFDGPEHEIDELHIEVPPLMIVRHDIHEVVPILVDHEVSVTSWAEKQSYEAWAAELVSV